MSVLSGQHDRFIHHSASYLCSVSNGHALATALRMRRCADCHASNRSGKKSREKRRGRSRSFVRMPAICPVLFVEGERGSAWGPKQKSVLNTSSWCAPTRKSRFPVSCVENRGVCGTQRALSRPAKMMSPSAHWALRSRVRVNAFSSEGGRRASESTRETVWKEGRRQQTKLASPRLYAANGGHLRLGAKYTVHNKADAEATGRR